MYVTANGNFNDFHARVHQPVNGPEVAAFNATQPPPSKEQVEALNRFEEICANAMMSRSELIKKFMDPRRDINDECGYPKAVINASTYQDLFDREPIANRVVTVFAKESWQVTPLVFETEDVEDVTEFELGWDELGQSLRGEQCFYQDEEGSPVWEYLKRLDVQSGIGHFGILLLGFDDGLPYSEPVGGVGVKIGVDRENEIARGVEEKPSDREDEDLLPGEVAAQKRGNPRKPGATTNRLIRLVANERPSPALQPIAANGVGDSISTSPFARGVFSKDGTAEQYYGVSFQPDEPKPKGENVKLNFVRVFPESLVQVVQWESNINSPRFGQPIRYSVTFNDPREQHSGVGLPLATVYVHWTRVLHVADNLNSSEVVGVPRMRPVLNRLLDLLKLYGGSAEMYWRGAFPGFALSTHPQLGGDVNVDVSGIRDMMENYMNGLQRYLALMGMSAQSLAPQVVSPVDQINVQIEAICICLGIPKRVFMGSERGELASSQDDAAWNDRLKGRQNSYITPRIIIPFVDRLIAVGVLPEPGKRNRNDQKNQNGSAGFASKNGFPPKKDKLPPSNGEPVGALDEGVTGNWRGGGGGGGGPPGGPPAAPAAPAFKLPKSREKTDVVRSRLGYSVQWPDLTSQTSSEKAAVAAQETAALAQYVSGGIDAMIQPKDYLVEFLGKDEEIAESMLQASEAVQEEKEADALKMKEEQTALADEHGLEAVVPGFTSKIQQPKPVVAPVMAPPPGGAPKPGLPFGKSAPGKQVAPNFSKPVVPATNNLLSPLPLRNPHGVRPSHVVNELGAVAEFGRLQRQVVNAGFDSLPRDAQKAAFASMESGTSSERESALKKAHATGGSGRSWEDVKKDYLEAGGTKKGFFSDMEKLYGSLADLQTAYAKSKKTNNARIEIRSFTGAATPIAPAEFDPVAAFGKAKRESILKKRRRDDLQVLANEIVAASAAEGVERHRREAPPEAVPVTSFTGTRPKTLPKDLEAVANFSRLMTALRSS